MNPAKITAVANTPALLLAADNGRNGARIENPLSVPIWVGRSATPDLGPPSLRVAPANSSGDPGWYVFDGSCMEAWYYQTTGSGDFTIHAW